MRAMKLGSLNTTSFSPLITEISPAAASRTCTTGGPVAFSCSMVTATAAAATPAPLELDHDLLEIFRDGRPDGAVV